MYHFRLSSEHYSVYDDPRTCRYAIVARAAPRRGGQPRWVVPQPIVLRLLKRVLVEDGRLFSYSGTLAIKLNGQCLVKLHESRAMWALLDQLVSFGLFTGENDLPTVLAPAPNVASIPETDHWRTWENIARTNNIHPLEVDCDKAYIWNDLYGPEVPEFYLTLKHPVHGEAPSGFFAPEAPGSILRATPTKEGPLFAELKNVEKWPGFGPAARRYPLLTQLFSPCKLSPHARCRLYVYLLAAFSAESLQVPAPLLVVDSWEQGVGKTEILSVLGYLLDGMPSNLSQPEGNDNEVMVAHYHNDNRFAGIDNLSNRHNWNNTWLATLLTDRAATARPKYGKIATRFCGRMAGASCVWGAVTLHPDLLSRTWRIPLEGWRGDLGFFCDRFARDHRSVLISEIMDVLGHAHPWSLPGRTSRVHDFETIGAAAFSHLAGISHAAVKILLEKSQKEVDGLGSAMLYLYSKQNLELPDDALRAAVGGSKPTDRSMRQLEGALARGYRYTKEFRFVKEHADAP